MALVDDFSKQLSEVESIQKNREEIVSDNAIIEYEKNQDIINAIVDSIIKKIDSGIKNIFDSFKSKWKPGDKKQFEFKIYLGGLSVNSHFENLFLCYQKEKKVLLFTNKYIVVEPNSNTGILFSAIEKYMNENKIKKYSLDIACYWSGDAGWETSSYVGMYSMKVGEFDGVNSCIIKDESPANLQFYLTKRELEKQSWWDSIHNCYRYRPSEKSFGVEICGSIVL